MVLEQHTDWQEEGRGTQHALGKIRRRGYLVLGNAERRYYEETIRSLLSSYKRTDFAGIGPYAPCPWQTTIWKIEPGSRIET